jgi:hypothetical protein
MHAPGFWHVNIASLAPAAQKKYTIAQEVTLFRVHYISIYRVSQNLCHKLFLGIPHPPLKQNSSYLPGSKSEQVPRYRLTFMCWYWVLHKMFKVLTICRNTSVETSHHGFPDAFQLKRVRESMIRRAFAFWSSHCYEYKNYSLRGCEALYPRFGVI